MTTAARGAPPGDSPSLRPEHRSGCRSASVGVKAPALAMLARVQAPRGSLAGATSSALGRGRGLTPPGLRGSRCLGVPDGGVSVHTTSGHRGPTMLPTSGKTNFDRRALTNGPSHENGRLILQPIPSSEPPSPIRRLHPRSGFARRLRPA